MADNDEAGGSGAHARSDDEDLENHYLQFLSQQNPDDAAEDAAEEADEDDGYEENTENNTTDTGGTSGSASKRQRKDRRQNMVGTGRLPITEVDPTSGLPVAPEINARGFGNVCAAIARELCSINEGHLRYKDKQPMERLLVKRLHERYKFPAPYNTLHIKDNIVNTAALGKISKGLGSWKYRLRKMLDKDCSFEEVHSHYPQISVEEWNTFKEAENTPTRIAKRG